MCSGMMDHENIKWISKSQEDKLLCDDTKYLEQTTLQTGGMKADGESV